MEKKMVDEIFLSYKSEDRTKAKIFVEALEKKGYRVWWDRKNESGNVWDERLEKALNDAKCVVVLWSKNSVDSNFVKNEARDGAGREILTPVLIDEVKIPIEFSHLHTTNLIEWQGSLNHPEFHSLIKTIAKILGGRETDILEEPHENYTNSIGMKFRLIPSGWFMMGSNEFESEKPVHKVTIKEPFYLGIYPVTRQERCALMKDDRSNFNGDTLPVEKVSWKDVEDFIEKLNNKEGTDKYRLPSEAEWEYAARARTSTRYSFGDNESKLLEYAWFEDGSKGKIHEVGQLKPNTWGLYDMHGNVWEWVQDKWNDNYHKAPTDGEWWQSGDESNRVIRGGGWDSNARDCRSATRGYNPCAGRRNFYPLGFRLVKDL